MKKLITVFLLTVGLYGQQFTAEQRNAASVVLQNKDLTEWVVKVYSENFGLAALFKTTGPVVTPVSAKPPFVAPFIPSYMTDVVKINMPPIPNSKMNSGLFATKETCEAVSKRLGGIRVVARYQITGVFDPEWSAVFNRNGKEVVINCGQIARYYDNLNSADELSSADALAKNLVNTINVAQ